MSEQEGKADIGQGRCYVTRVVFLMGLESYWEQNLQTLVSHLPSEQDTCNLAGEYWCFIKVVP